MQRSTTHIILLYIAIHITYVYSSKRFKLTNHNLTFGSGSGGHQKDRSKSFPVIPGRSKKVAQVEESEEERSEGRLPTHEHYEVVGFFNRGKRGGKPRQNGAISDV